MSGLRLRSFDAYAKTLDDFSHKTYTGAAVSIMAGLLMLILFASELGYYLSTDVSPELFVDTSRNEKMRINLDIIFPEMPCSYLSIDVMDISGEQQLDVMHTLYKRRLDKDGNTIQEELHEEIGHGDIATNASDSNALANLDPERCESCYGAETKDHQCCNNCEQVREAYRKKGWAFNNAEGITQCEREGWSDTLKAQADEGCSMHGFLLVNKVAGNFHFAPGKSFQQHNVHIHDLQPFGRSVFNMSHEIRHLSFGHDYPGLVNPLDKHSQISTDGSYMYQYYLKVVPTRYEKLNGQSINTNQYSVATHKKPVTQKLGDNGLPGVFFMFEISPILVQLKESRRSFMHFVTGVCAIIGGIFTVAGMIDSIIFSFQQWQKRQLGKN